MPHDVKKNQKAIATGLRKKGMSYGEIQKELSIPKSTLSLWLKKIPLTVSQRKKLSEHRSKIARDNIEGRIAKTAQDHAKIFIEAARSVKNISSRELWLMGVILFWKSGALPQSQKELNKGVSFMSSDPYLIKLFLRWMQEIGKLKKSEFLFDIFYEADVQDHPSNISSISDPGDTNNAARGDGEIKKNNHEREKKHPVQYWSKITKFPLEYFPRLYTTKPYIKRGVRKVIHKSEFGQLRVRVSSSTLLNLQIAGWIEGVKRFYW